MRTIAITGGKGGTGKSNTAINLGMALNQYKKDVIIVDGNLTTPDIGIYLGNPINPVTLHDVLKGKKHIKQAIYNHHSGTKIIPGSISLNSLKEADPEKLPKELSKLSADYILIDTAAGLGREALSAIKSANEVLIVTNPELTAVTDALKTIRLCTQLKKKILGVVVTKTNPKNADLSIEGIESILEKPVIGVIPEDRAVKFAIAKKDSVIHTYPNSVAAINYMKLAASLSGEEYLGKTLEEQKSILESIGDSIVRWLGLKD